MSIMSQSAEQLGLEVRDMVDRYIHYRYSEAFLRDMDVKAVTRVVHDPTHFAYRVTIDCFPGRWPSCNDDRKYQCEIRIDGNDAEQNREEHEWFMYQTQAIIPMLDSGIFSVWLGTRSLTADQRRVYNNRVLPQMEQVRLINRRPDQHQVSHDSLAVIKMKNACEWREQLMKIEEDPEAFVAALLMVTP